MPLASLPAIAAAVDACRRVAPADLAEQAVYVVPYSDVAESHPELARSEASGWTMPGLDLALRPWLATLGRWRGRGFACLIDDRLPRWLVVGIVLHELAHWLTYQDQVMATCDEDSAGELVAEHVGVVHPRRDGPGVLSVAVESAIAGARPLRVATPNAQERRDAHDLAFHRAAVHVRHRAKLAGIDVRNLTFAGDAYGLSSPLSYIEALAEECECMVGEPIAGVLASPAPDQLAELWQADNSPVRCAEWEARQSD